MSKEHYIKLIKKNGEYKIPNRYEGVCLHINKDKASKLRKLILNKKLKSISCYGYDEMSSIEEIAFNEDLDHISGYFMKSDKLERLDFNSNLKYIVGRAFICKNLKYVTFKSFPSIAWDSFMYCKNIKKIEFNVDDNHKEFILNENQWFERIFTTGDEKYCIEYKDNVEKTNVHVEFDSKSNRIETSKELYGLPYNTDKKNIVVPGCYNKISLDIKENDTENMCAIDLCECNCETQIIFFGYHNIDKIILPDISNEIRIICGSSFNGRINNIIIKSNRTNTLDCPDLELTFDENENVYDIRSIDEFYVINYVDSNNNVYAKVIDKEFNIKTFQDKIIYKENLIHVQKYLSCEEADKIKKEHLLYIKKIIQKYNIKNEDVHNLAKSIMYVDGDIEQIFNDENNKELLLKNIGDKYAKKNIF